MRRKILTLFFALVVLLVISFKNKSNAGDYVSDYAEKLNKFKERQESLLETIERSNINSVKDIETIIKEIESARNALKGIDFWLRYLEPVVYKKINGPLPVEWETEVFEKFEKPYKREGAGLTLAGLYLQEETVNKEFLLDLVKSSIDAIATFEADSITKNLETHHHFYLSNRLYLLNLAAIYSTGFECPDTSRVIPELRLMLEDVSSTYQLFNAGFSNTPLTTEYLGLYKRAIAFVSTQSPHYSRFDHFTFIRDYVNPLFAINQKLIKTYNVTSKSYVDYSLNKNNTSIFNKSLYNGQSTKGIFLRVTDEEALSEIDKLGRLLFYDPILSGNNLRSCASCHKPTEFFTDTTVKTSLHFDHTSFLPRNSPSLLNAGANHLIMLDGKHTSLQNQTKDVITNPLEMGSNEEEILNKVLSCDIYRKAFTKLLKYTPQEKEITFHHITSAITFYYGKFSDYYAPFDEAMNEQKSIDKSVQAGFNLFMSRAQCATCHFVPQFNGIKPPYVSSEFEVLGVPADTGYRKLSPDEGRYGINPAYETRNAFRTGSIRNSEFTKPYMHNGVFNTLNEVIDFYNAGGGAGRGLQVDNQTLSLDSLGLTNADKLQLINFIHSLNENIQFESPPEKLPTSKYKNLNQRKVGGEY